MRRIMAIITFLCFLAVSTAEGRVLLVCVKTGCTFELVPPPDANDRACGSCSPIISECEIYRCVPVSDSCVLLKNMIEYNSANSLSSRCSNELSNPVLNAVLGDTNNLSAKSPQGRILEKTIRYNELFSYRAVSENLVFIHPQISITVLRL